MKKIILFLFLLGYSFSLAQQPVKLDIKTSFEGNQKKSFEAIKQASIGYFKKCMWVKIKEFNEDYSLWILNPVRTFDKSDMRIETLDFDLELHAPSLINKGKLIQRQHIRFTFNTAESVKDKNQIAINRAINVINNQSNDLMPVAFIAGGETILLAKGLLEIVSLFTKDFTDAEKTEALIAGAFVCSYTYRILVQIGAIKTNK